MATKEATLQQAAITKALAKLDDPRLEKALDAQIEAEMRKLIPSNSVTDGPGPSASDPTD